MDETFEPIQTTDADTSLPSDLPVDEAGYGLELPSHQIELVREKVFSPVANPAPSRYEGVFEGEF